MPFSFLRDRFRPATRTAATVPGLRRISAQTVRNRLHTAGLRARQPAVRLLLHDRHRAARWAWAREHVRWTRDQWRRVIWSDESRFCMQRVDGRIRVWRRRGERHSQNCIVERDRGRGGSVCVWGAIGIGVKTDMVHFNGYVNAQVYMDNALIDQVVPLFQTRHFHARQCTATCSKLKKLIPAMLIPKA